MRAEWPNNPPALAATHVVASRASGLNASAVPPDAWSVAKQCVLDWFAVTLAARTEPLVAMLRDQAADEGARPTATILGMADKGSTRQAALVNGAAGHALDYDDVNLAMAGHPTVAILPGLLAMAERDGASGEALITAFIAGYEAAGMIGGLVGPGHYARGFHATATVGTLGSAAACAHLLRLDEAATARALGIAGTMAAGLKSQFGTMCKPLHAGRAAESGLVAAGLAARGFSSRPDVLECAQGFAATQSPDFNPHALLPRGSDHFHVRDNLFKFNAACYGTHGAIEGLRRLARDHSLKAADVRAIQLDVEPDADKMCDIREPRTGLETKFSIRANAALALLGRDTAAPETYSDATAADPEVIALRDRVSVRTMPAGWSPTLTEIVVETAQGTRLTARYDTGVPAADVADQAQRIRAKFMSLVVPAIGRAKAEVLADRIENLEQESRVDDLVAPALSDLPDRPLIDVSSPRAQ